MSTVKNRNNWIFDRAKEVIDNKELLKQNLITSMLNVTTRMFKYDGLPETITSKDLETQLQVGGFSIWKDVDDKLYSFVGTLGGQPNPYYLPTLAIVANPALKYNSSLEIDKQCVVMRNDNYYQGLMPVICKYADLITEAELSLKYCLYNARIPAIMQADNDNTKQSAENFFKKIINGEEYGIVGSKQLFDGLKSFEFTRAPFVKDIIESIQYLKGSFYNEIGLQSQFNMKREAINEAEATLNDDILMPTIDTMYDNRVKALEKINGMFGTNITVDFDSSWKTNKVEKEISIKQAELEAEQNPEPEKGEENENI